MGWHWQIIIGCRECWGGLSSWEGHRWPGKWSARGWRKGECWQISFILGSLHLVPKEPIWTKGHYFCWLRYVIVRTYAPQEQRPWLCCSMASRTGHEMWYTCSVGIYLTCCLHLVDPVSEGAGALVLYQRKWFPEFAKPRKNQHFLFSYLYSNIKLGC